MVDNTVCTILNDVKRCLGTKGYEDLVEQLEKSLIDYEHAVLKDAHYGFLDIDYRDEFKSTQIKLGAIYGYAVTSKSAYVEVINLVNSRKEFFEQDFKDQCQIFGVPN